MLKTLRTMCTYSTFNNLYTKNSYTIILFILHQEYSSVTVNNIITLYMNENITSTLQIFRIHFGN